jgi:hypothetical protein
MLKCLINLIIYPNPVYSHTQSRDNICSAPASSIRNANETEVDYTERNKHEKTTVSLFKNYFYGFWDILHLGNWFSKLSKIKRSVNGKTTPLYTVIAARP